MNNILKSSYRAPVPLVCPKRASEHSATRVNECAPVPTSLKWGTGAPTQQTFFNVLLSKQPCPQIQGFNENTQMNKIMTSTTADDQIETVDFTFDDIEPAAEIELQRRQSLFRFLSDIDKVSLMSNDGTAFMLSLGHIAQMFIAAWKHPNSSATDFEQACSQLQHSFDAIAMGYSRLEREKRLFNAIADRLTDIIDKNASYSTCEHLNDLDAWKAAQALLD